MLTKEKIIKIVSKAIKKPEKKININSKKEDFETWDSLAHLKILTDIDDLTQGKASEISDLANATKIINIYKILLRKKLAK